MLVFSLWHFRYQHFRWHFVVGTSLLALCCWHIRCWHFCIGTLSLACWHFLCWHFRYQHFRWHFVVGTSAAGTFVVGTFVISTFVGTLLFALSHIQLAFSPPVPQSPDFDVLSEPRLRR
jgi:hypothetical protein